MTEHKKPVQEEINPIIAKCLPVLIRHYNNDPIKSNSLIEFLCDKELAYLDEIPEHELNDNKKIFKVAHLIRKKCLSKLAGSQETPSKDKLKLKADQIPDIVPIISEILTQEIITIIPSPSDMIRLIPKKVFALLTSSLNAAFLFSLKFPTEPKPETLNGLPDEDKHYLPSNQANFPRDFLDQTYLNRLYQRVRYHKGNTYQALFFWVLDKVYKDYDFSDYFGLDILPGRIKFQDEEKFISVNLEHFYFPFLKSRDSITSTELPSLISYINITEDDSNSARSELQFYDLEGKAQYMEYRESKLYGKGSIYQGLQEFLKTKENEPKTIKEYSIIQLNSPHGVPQLVNLKQQLPASDLLKNDIFYATRCILTSPFDIIVGVGMEKKGFDDNGTLNLAYPVFEKFAADTPVRVAIDKMAKLAEATHKNSKDSSVYIWENEQSKINVEIFVSNFNIKNHLKERVRGLLGRDDTTLGEIATEIHSSLNTVVFTWPELKSGENEKLWPKNDDTDLSEVVQSKYKSYFEKFSTAFLELLRPGNSTNSTNNPLFIGPFISVVNCNNRSEINMKDIDPNEPMTIGKKEGSKYEICARLNDLWNDEICCFYQLGSA